MPYEQVSPLGFSRAAIERRRHQVATPQLHALFNSTAAIDDDDGVSRPARRMTPGIKTPKTGKWKRMIQGEMEDGEDDEPGKQKELPNRESNPG
ncbi:hypothetical protein B9479_007268 [Cryptococcus floricola]|uniref:Uncharacterized protein n=1 Tax=Cryptococcus floricola TaxID=2591691 RepID=A0A5D3APY7_9TREE|nr:hypothetical protein B9479_007268 [Cryptococcus floricola]